MTISWARQPLDTRPQVLTYHATCGVRLTEFVHPMGRCADSLYEWGVRYSPECNCGARKQTIEHIAFECPTRSYHGPRIDYLTTPTTFIQWLERLDLRLWRQTCQPVKLIIIFNHCYLNLLYILFLYLF